MPLHGFRRVARAAWLESTGGSQERRDRELIAADRPRQQALRPGAAPLDHASRTARATSFDSASLSSPNSSSVAGWRAITSTSSGERNDPRSLRNHSRIRRFTRFRATELPTFLLAVMPSRGPLALSRDATRTTNAFDTARRPCCATCWYSLDRSSRSDRPKPPVGPDTLLRGDRDRDPLAALGTPTLEDISPPSGLHPLSEAVNTLPPDPARLVRPLHRGSTGRSAVGSRLASRARDISRASERMSTGPPSHTHILDCIPSRSVGSTAGSP